MFSHNAGRITFNSFLNVFDLVMACYSPHNCSPRPLVSAQCFPVSCLEHSTGAPAIVYFYKARKVALRCMLSAVLQPGA